ncbi:MAG TPA: hypothetical protein VH352_11135 [Pseudonocardiaceae bacterium]|jgi:hypothetical protein|nr:hypothetical protein [Pseudonocardiaceae bacterium]
MTVALTRQLPQVRADRPDDAPGRMSTAMGIAAGFGVYLVVAAVVTAVPMSHPAGIIVLVAVAGTLSRWATGPGALGIGLLGWPFYSGFIAHAHGQLSISGGRDAIVLGALVGTALLTVAVRTLLCLGRAPIPAIPLPRHTVD